MTVSSGWNSRDVNLNGRLIGRDRGDAGQRREAVEQHRLARPDLADDRDDDAARADVVERRQAFRQDLALHAEDLGLGGADGHHDEHRARVSLVGRPGQTKKQRSCLCFVRPARPVPPVLVTENHHAGHRK